SLPDGVGGEYPQGFHFAAILSLNVLSKKLHAVAQEQEEGLSALHTPVDFLFPLAHSGQNQLLALLTHRVHTAQIHILREESGLVVQLGEYKLCLGQALL